MNKRLAALALIATTLLVLASIIYSPTLTGKATSGFSVGLSVDPASIQWSNYEQNSTATNGGGQVTLTAPITYYLNGSQGVTDPIIDYFTAGNNFTIYEENQLSTTRTGDTLSWTANLSTTAYAQWLVPAPTRTVTTEDTDAYRIDFTIASTTPLRNATFTVSVPSGISNAALFEILGGTIDRTNTYDLQVSGGTATFTNVFFTNNTLSRTLYLTADPTPPSSGGGGGGGGGSGPPREVVYNLPEKIVATAGETTSLEGTIINNEILAVDLSLTYNPRYPGLTITPASFSIPSGEEATITFMYSPPAQTLAATQQTTLTFTGDDEHAHQLLVQAKKKIHEITLDEPEDEESFSISVYDEYVELSGEITSVDEVTATLEVFLRDDTGETVKSSTRTFTTSQSYSFSERLFIDGLQPGTYEACVSLTDDTNVRSEECRSLTIVDLREETPGVIEEATDMIIILLWMLIGVMLVLNVVVFFGDHFSPVQNALLKIYRFTHKK